MAHSASITPHDRASFTVFIAMAIHVVILLGVGFTSQEKPTLAPTLEVTIASFRSKEKPKNPDYIAQINQEGSGTLDKKALQMTDVISPFQDSKITNTQNIIRSTPRPKSENKQKQTAKVTTESASTNKVHSGEVSLENLTNEQDQQPINKQINLVQEIASLEAQFRNERQEYARRPKIKRLTAASTLQESGAIYKESWRKKVEKIGNLNYPEKARKEKLYGELSLMVAINNDGSLQNISIITSSGLKILDDAAVRIVRLAAPFSPFGDDLEDYDIVEIVRTWRFESGGKLFSE